MTKLLKKSIFNTAKFVKLSPSGSSREHVSPTSLQIRLPLPPEPLPFHFPLGSFIKINFEGQLVHSLMNNLKRHKLNLHLL